MANANANRRKPTGGGFTKVYTLDKDRTATCLLAYLWQQDNQKITDSQLRQLAKGEEVEIRLTEAQATTYPVPAYKSVSRKGGIFTEEDVERLKDIGLGSDSDFIRVAIWNDSKELLEKEDTEEFFDALAHVEKILAGQKTASSKTEKTESDSAKSPAPAKDLDAQVLEFLEGLEPEERNKWLNTVSMIVKIMNQKPETTSAMEAWLKKHTEK